MGKYISLQGADAIDVHVTVDGIERIGVLEAWRQDEGGNWAGFVRYAAPIGDGSYTSLHLGWFAAEHIKRDEQPDDDPRAHEDDAPTPAAQPPHQDDEATH